MVLITKNQKAINRTEFFYSSECLFINSKIDLIKRFKNVTVYGVSLGKTKIRYQDSILNTEAESYFSLNITTLTKMFSIEPSQEGVALFIRHGFIGLNQVGLNCEKSGRLTYINGCTDSTLIFPPRFGDPSLSLLSFPEQTEQAFHRHPTLRFGVILEGSGIAEFKKKKYTLQKHDIFCIDENEAHRFKTANKGMRLIAYHPDSDFGPKDNNHAMLNRTFLKE